MRILAFTSVVVLMSCTTGYHPQVENAHSRRNNEIWVWAASQMVSADCDGVSAMGASRQTIRLGELTASQPCGWITTDVTGKKFLAHFISDACNGEDGPECATSYTEMFIARLSLRYERADWTRVSKMCSAYPSKCKQFQTIELWAMQSHNAAVVAAARKAYADESVRYQAEYRRAEEEEDERGRRVIRAIGAALEGANSVYSKVRCTSVTTGSVTQTNCR